MTAPQEMFNDGHRQRDSVALLDALRARLAPHAPHVGETSDAASSLDSISAAVERLLAEHGGMAEELLCAYEQLGVVFDLTRRLATAQTERDVVDLFAQRLSASFAGRLVCVARRRHGRWTLDDATLDAEDWIQSLVLRSCEKGSAVVDDRAGDEARTGNTQALAAPVLVGDEPACVVVIVRPANVAELRAVDMLLVDSLATFCGDLIRNLRLVRELRDLSMAMVRSLVNAVDQKDEYTCGHSLRVGYYASSLGRRLKLREVDLQMLQWSALLHDVGKIGIRDAVLKKEGRLSDDEFSHMKEHPVRSHRVVQAIPQLAAALDGILYHHEHYDGTGYPQGLKGADIPLQARVIQIADVFDALTSNRSYRKAFDWRKALDIMREEAGTIIDPYLYQVFAHMMTQALEHDDSVWDRMIAAGASLDGPIDDPLAEAPEA